MRNFPQHKGFSWAKYEKGDPSFLFELLPKIAMKEGELGTVLGLGTGYLLEKWGLSEEAYKKVGLAKVGEELGKKNLLP